MFDINEMSKYANEMLREVDKEQVKKFVEELDTTDKQKFIESAVEKIKKELNEEDAKAFNALVSSFLKEFGDIVK